MTIKFREDVTKSVTEKLEDVTKSVTELLGVTKSVTESPGVTKGVTKSSGDETPAYKDLSGHGRHLYRRPTPPRPGRPPKGEKAMTAAEKQRDYRLRKRENGNG